MRGLNKHVKVYPTFTSDDWNLYSLSDPDKCEEAVKELNETLSRLVYFGRSRKAVSAGIHEVMESHAEVGALDSEPLEFLEKVLDEIFGKEHGSS